MASSIFILLLLLLSVACGCKAQSGDGDTDMARIRCESHISTAECSVTCQMIVGSVSEDDEDTHDAVERITVCCVPYDWRDLAFPCIHGDGDTVTSSLMDPLLDINVTVHLKSKRTVTTIIDLRTIVKPRSPRVVNVTFDLQSSQAEILLWIPYTRDFLKVENLLFQIEIRCAGVTMVQNMSMSLMMRIDMQHLHGNAEYDVRARSIPVKYLQGSWSEWSEAYSFHTPEDPTLQEQQDVDAIILYSSMAFLLPLAVSLCLFLLWKNKIFTYMWPNIPHPKNTLVQICKPQKGLLLNFKPEVFSALRVSPMDQSNHSDPINQSEDEAAILNNPNHPCSSSSQSSDCATSTTTEEIDLSALLSHSNSMDGEEGLQSTGPTPTEVLQIGERSQAVNEAMEVLERNKKEEAYVTMSSFYRIK